MPRPQGIGYSDPEVRLEERSVVVAPIPDYHIGLLFGCFQNGLVIDTGIHHRPTFDVCLVLFSLLDGDFCIVQFFQ